MAVALPTGDMLETPPGYPFEEINYEDIAVEEVGRLVVVVVVVVAFTAKRSNGGEMTTWCCQVECPY